MSSLFPIVYETDIVKLTLRPTGMLLIIKDREEWSAMCEQFVAIKEDLA